jgi:Xaa-Pro dipeptidase
MTGGVSPISKQEYGARLSKLQDEMKQASVSAVFLHASSSLYYFTGLRWNASERMVGAIVFADGKLAYIAPFFEADTLKDYWLIEAPLHLWQEHEVPSQLLRDVFVEHGVDSGKVLLDPALPFRMAEAIVGANKGISFESAHDVIDSIRSIKSEAELSIIRRAHEMTLEVQRAAASILRPGITTTEVAEFINEAHQQVGAAGGSSFVIVLFGVATSFPHGVKEPQILKEEDWVLVDTGCLLFGYNSDITRTYPFGDPTDRQREAWDFEKSAQLAAFDAVKPGVACEAADLAARASLESNGFGPGYELPGLPHRAGHGCGLDIHEAPYLVKGESTLLQEGMVFSSEPMLVLPDEFGVRLEDHFFVTKDGAEWFTEPSKSIDDPFDLV